MNRPSDAIMEAIVKANRLIEYCESRIEEHYVPGPQERAYAHMLEDLVGARNQLDVMLVESRGLPEVKR